MRRINRNNKDQNNSKGLTALRLLEEKKKRIEAQQNNNKK